MKIKPYTLIAVLLLFPFISFFSSLSRATESEKLEGLAEFGQTHIIQANESRLSPHLVGERDTLLLFTPKEALPEDAILEVTGFSTAGKKLASIRMQPPSSLFETLEQQISGVPLAPYSEQSWSIMLPWHWIKPGLTLNLTYKPNDHSADTTKSDTLQIPVIGAPAEYSFNRLKIRAWDGQWYDHQEGFNDTIGASELIRNFYGSIPVSRMIIADYSPMHLDRMLIPTVFGPALVTTDEEMKLTGRSYYNYVLKNITINGAMLANTGAGLLPSGLSAMPRSTKNHVGMGQALKSDGNYRSMIDEGFYGGSHGWSAIGWNTECGNAFIHETGHGMSLGHFTEGSAEKWGISDEYPEDGVNLPSHPAGFHSLFRKFRTWYKVDTQGAKKDDTGKLLGKKDPMNGGDPAYKGKYCFPQYTAYHSKKVQQFFESRQVLQETENGLALHQWDSTTGQYVKSTHQPDITPTATGKGIALVIATIAEDGNQGVILPVVTSAHGNLYQHPSPIMAGLNNGYHGSQFYFEVDFGDRKEYILIGKPVLESNGVYTVSVNLPFDEAGSSPYTIKLYRANKSYPEISLQDSTLLDERAIHPQPNTPQTITVGGGYDGQLNPEVTAICQENCLENTETIRVNFSHPQGSTVFLPFYGNNGQIQWEGIEGETVLSISAHDEDGGAYKLNAKAVREVTLADGQKLRLPINDATAFPDTIEEALVLWVPQALNTGIDTGSSSHHLTNYWRETAFSAYNVVDGQVIEASAREIDIRVNLWTTTTTAIDLTTDDYLGLGYPELYPDKLKDSTIYYLTNNPQIGPIHQVWGTSPDYALLSIPMVHEPSGDIYTVIIRAQRRSHPWAGNWRAMNDSVLISGSGGNAYTTHLRLSFQAGDNPSLPTGRYQTKDNQKLYIEGRAHHAAHKLLGIHFFDISVTNP